MASAAAKQPIREQIRASRRLRPPAERDRCGQRIADHGLAAWSTVRSVAAFLSVGVEVPTGPLVEGLHAAGVRVLVPVVRGDELGWVVHQPGAVTERGQLGIPEPVGPVLPGEPLTAVAVVVVPALAVDRQGNRLGRGRGYYDRALAGVTAPVVAVGYDEELLAAVPSEPHDRRVDGMLRPGGLTWFG